MSKLVTGKLRVSFPCLEEPNTLSEKYQLDLLVPKDSPEVKKIKKAIEEIFGVTVIKVTTENVRGKMKRNGAYPMGRQASWKKAVVKLSADSKNIELFEGMA